MDLRGPLPGSLGLPERALAALVGFVAFSVVLMLIHIVTGGAVFGLPGVVPALAFGVVLWGARHHIWRVRGVPWLRVVAAVAVISALFIVPAVGGGSAMRTGDDPWHLGWTEQLLHGMPIPVGPAPVDANAYPWGFHAVMATMVRMVPGTDPPTALEALDMLIALAIPTAAACLARRLDRRAGWGAAAATALVGGFGWILAWGPAFLTSPRHPQYGADLVAASPNAMYELFPPPLPRELGLAMLGAVGFLVVAAARRGRRGPAVLSGVVLGLVGLVSVPMFVSAAVWTVAGVAVARSGTRLRLLAWMLAPAALLFAAWAAPVTASYLRYGGFVDTTAHLGYEWPLITSLGSWGMLLPLALAGLWLTLRSRDPRGRPVIAFVAAALCLLGLSFARGAFGWDLGGNATLLHQGRMWPPLHLLGGAFAGIVPARLWSLVEPRRRLLGAGMSLAILGVGAVSPALASIQMTRIIHSGSGGFVYGADDYQAGSFVRRAASQLQPGDVVAVQGARSGGGASLLAFALFQFSGARLAAYENEKLQGNDLRIRYRELAHRWDRRIAGRGYRSDFRVVSCGTRCPPGALESGDFAGSRWALVRAAASI